MASRLSKPNYSTFSDDENENIYSPVPQKYRSKKTKDFRMILRPRMPLKTLNVVKSLSKAYIPLKSCRKVLKRGTKDKDTSVSKKAKNPFGSVTEKVGTKERHRSTNVLKTPEQPYRTYRERLRESPSTPSSFCSPDAFNLRRSKRLSMLGTGTPNTPSNGKTPFKRKREYRPDAFNSHLELVETGIKKLRANGDQLSKAIQHNDKAISTQSTERSEFEEQLTNAFTSEIKPQSKYVPIFESSTPVPVADCALRRAKSSRASTTGRRLSSKFNKSTLTIDNPLRSRRYNEMISDTSGKALRGKYNQALYYDG